MARFIMDSCGDTFQIEGVDFKAAPLTISTNEKDYVDNENLNITEMLDDLAAYKGKSSTACPSVETWLETFEGAETIYVVTMSSNLSGTYNSAQIAKEMYEQEHQGAKIHVFDTLSAGPELKVLLEKLIEWDKEGKTFEEICECGEAYLNRTRVFFSLKSLHNLAQNGRVSKVVAAAAGALGISVVGTGSKEGTLDPIAKCRGDKKVIAKFIEEMEGAGFTNGKVRMNHVENPELAEKLKATILQKFPGADVEIYKAGALCSYYAERGGIIIGIECNG